MNWFERQNRRKPINSKTRWPPSTFQSVRRRFRRFWMAFCRQRIVVFNSHWENNQKVNNAFSRFLFADSRTHMNSWMFFSHFFFIGILFSPALIGSLLFLLITLYAFCFSFREESKNTCAKKKRLQRFQSKHTLIKKWRKFNFSISSIESNYLWSKVKPIIFKRKSKNKTIWGCDWTCGKWSIG